MAVAGPYGAHRPGGWGRSTGQRQWLGEKPKEKQGRIDFGVHSDYLIDPYFYFG